MKGRNISILCVLVIGLMLGSLLVPFGFIGNVVAPVGQQHNIYWHAKAGPTVAGAPDAGPGRVITAWIDGVSYGTNVTDENSKFDLYIDGDTWGLNPYDWYKSGGYDGDVTQYWLDYDPSDYTFMISDYTTSFFTGDYENETLFFDEETNTDGLYTDTYLRGIKIQEIYLDPLATLTQYVILYDPGGQLSEAALEDLTHGYYLQKDDPSGHSENGPIWDFNTSANDVIRYGTSNYYYINLTSPGTFSLNSQDELKLVWKNPSNHGGLETADKIANNTDVIVDRVEWGNYHNVDPMDYDNTTLVDTLLTPPSGSSLNRTSAGWDTDNCAVDFKIQTPAMARAVSGAAPPPAMPGPPTNLRVHKGGGAWGGAAGDLVLYWTAPSVDWDKLAMNIVYYDMDLTNGFQYANWIMFAPNSTVAGGNDWCHLPGWLANSNNYGFVVRTTGDTQGTPNENPLGTNLGYKYVMVLQMNPSGQQFKWISLPYFCDYTKASDIAGPGVEFTDSTKIDTLVRWNYANQRYDRWYWQPIPPPAKWAGVDFTINPGDSLGVIITTNAPYEWKIVGSYDDTLEFQFLKNPSGQSFLTLSLPYHKAYVNPSDIAGPGAEFTDNTVIDTIVQWNFAQQRYDRWYWQPIPPPAKWAGNDFTINPSPGDALGFIVTGSISYPWKPEVL